MFGNMMERMQEMQQKTEDAKRRLDNITVTGEAPAGAVVVEMTGNKKVKNQYFLLKSCVFSRKKFPKLAKKCK